MEAVAGQSAGLADEALAGEVRMVAAAAFQSAVDKKERSHASVAGDAMSITTAVVLSRPEASTASFTRTCA